MLRLKPSLILLASLTVGGCFNDNEERRLMLGDVSLGDQLIDLKKAHEAGALSDKEYQKLRRAFIALITEQQQGEDNEDLDEAEAEAEEEEGFSWL